MLSLLVNSGQKKADSNKPEDIFYLHIDEVTEGQETPELDLKSLVAANRAPYEAVANVSDWPTVIDSRGKILRAPREDVEDGLGGDPISPGISPWTSQGSNDTL